MKRSWLYLLVAVVLVAVAALVTLFVLRPWDSSPVQRRFRSAVVAANGNECAAIGRSILEKGGSAVDAAIATLFCGGLGCAQCMGLGGGFLATIYDAKTKRVRVLNARERAPAATTIDMFDHASPTVGGLAVAVPGELRGYGAMHAEYGKLPWAELVKPTADLCRSGHEVTQYMGRVLQSYSDRFKAEPSMSEVYVNEATGEVYREGDRIQLQTLADTLDVIAAEGPEAMHNGSLTAKLVEDIQGFGGIITEDDLRNYRVEWQEPIIAELDDEHTLYVNPLPGSGSVLAFIVNMLRDWVGTPTVPVNSDLYWHRIVESFKYAYAKRTGLGDPTRNLTYDIHELERNISNPEWAASFRELVDDAHTFNEWEHYGAYYQGADDHGTAHVVVIAPDGSVVSATSTINYIWGSQRRSRSLGIILNNEMDDFAIPNTTSVYGLPPSPANFLAPGLNPLSSMVPSIVLDKKGEAVLATGSAGGTKITTQIALILRQIIIEGQDLNYAMTRPRLHHQLVPMEVEYEAGYDQQVINGLKAKGHVTRLLGEGAGFAAIIAATRDADGYLIAETDKRRVGSIDGF